LEEPTVTTPEKRIRDCYGIDFPDDFFRFRAFLEKLPEGVLSEACDLNAAFPFDVASGRPPRDYPEHPLWEDRYYHDLPEFVTVFTGTVDGVHWGYFFDAPGEYPPVVVHYWHSDTFQHAFDGDNIFEAVRLQVELTEQGYREDDQEDADYRQEQFARLQVIREALAHHWDTGRPQTGVEYFNKFHRSAWRKPVAKTWSDLGIVVPAKQYRRLSSEIFTDSTTGYRIEPQRPRIDALCAEAMNLLATGKPGAALKLGHDLWVWASDFPECYTLLDAAYTALGREPLRHLLAEAREFRAWCDRRNPPKATP
jgi:hypothetical protein